MELSGIYTPDGYNSTYTSILKTLYGINDGLQKQKRDGMMAPKESSLANTRELYRLIGQPLDSIPTIHIGGTNGKVNAKFVDFLKLEAMDGLT